MKNGISRLARWVKSNPSRVLWTAWVGFFAGYETYTLANKKDEDSLSENTRLLFRIRDSKVGRAVFTVLTIGGCGWFVLHILTETM